MAKRKYLTYQPPKLSIQLLINWAIAREVFAWWPVWLDGVVGTVAVILISAQLIDRFHFAEKSTITEILKEEAKKP